MKLESHYNFNNVWVQSFVNELGWLEQGIQNIKGTGINWFIPRMVVPTGRSITYGLIVMDYHPQKLEPNQTRLTIGGDCIDYLWDVATPMANITRAKLFFNFTVSTPGAKFFDVDIKFFPP